MQLDTLLLADAVSAPPDGKFYIHGGGLTRITVPHLPFTVPQLAVFVRLAIDATEVGETHQFQFELTDPEGVLTGQLPLLNAEIPPPPAGIVAPVEGEPRFVVIAVNIAGITVGRVGMHTFTFRIDDEPAHSMPLPVIVFSAEQMQAMALGALAPPARPPVTPPRNRAQRRQTQPEPRPRKPR